MALEIDVLQKSAQDPDINVSLAKALKIADGIIEAYPQSWRRILKTLNENQVNMKFAFGPANTNPSTSPTL